jgi:diguanylate cyclase (GGDEF)-like protein
MAQATREMANASRSKLPVSMLMIDLDHFKKVNDRCGHHVGDEVLRRVADIFRHWLRRGDLAGRIGGEEFAVILPRTGAEAALEVADRLRQFIEEARLPDDERECKVTASIGVATDADGIDGLEALMKRADEVLYQAKSRGRNRVLTDVDAPGQG